MEISGPRKTKSFSWERSLIKKSTKKEKNKNKRKQTNNKKMVNKKLIFGIILIVMLAMIFASFGVLASTGGSDCTQADCGGGQLITKTPAEDVEVEEGIKQLYQNGLVKDKECLSPNEFKFKTEYSKGKYGCCCKKTPTTDKCTQANDCPDGYTIYGEGQDK